MGEVGRGPSHLKHQSVTGILSCKILRCFQLPAKQDVGDAGAKDGEDDNANESEEAKPEKSASVQKKGIGRIGLKRERQTSSPG